LAIAIAIAIAIANARKLCMSMTPALGKPETPL
jgi:hypothetical protein